MIDCPGCLGRGIQSYATTSAWEFRPCGDCDGTGTVPDPAEVSARLLDGEVEDRLSGGGEVDQ